MEIETKYYIGDIVWVISNNKAVEKQVTLYNVTISESTDCKPKITYELNFETEKIDEDKLFTTKKELLESL